jgi:antitoxin component YwqK of YwqJK toxin-antitoxin module
MQTSIQDLPFELINMIVSMSPSPKDYLNFVLSGRIFYRSLTLKEKQSIRSGFLKEKRLETDLHTLIGMEFPNGRKDGLWLEYSKKDGRLIEEKNWKNGYMEGVTKTFQKGALIKERNFSRNELEGDCKRFYKSGKLRQEAFFQKNILVGNDLRWSEDGSLRESHRQPGKGWNEVTHYLPSGETIDVYTYYGGRRIISKFYYGNGKTELQSERVYSGGGCGFGKLNGYTGAWDEKGRIMFVLVFVNGKVKDEEWDPKFLERINQRIDLLYHPHTRRSLYRDIVKYIEKKTPPT